MSAAERLAVVCDAIATDPRDWWTGDEVDEFVTVWNLQFLPEIKMVDATGSMLTIWVTDPARAADMLGIDWPSDAAYFEIEQSEYKVCIVQYEK